MPGSMGGGGEVWAYDNTAVTKMSTTAKAATYKRFFVSMSYLFDESTRTGMSEKPPCSDTPPLGKVFIAHGVLQTNRRIKEYS